MVQVLAMFKLILFIAIQICGKHVSGNAIVEEIVITKGSTNGGTRFEVLGENFDETFSVAGDETVGSHVFLVTDRYTAPCAKLRVRSSDKIITCNTSYEPLKYSAYTAAILSTVVQAVAKDSRPMPSGYYKVRIVTNGILEPYTCDDCVFRTRSHNTPSITRVALARDNNTFAGPVNSFIHVEGRIITTVFGPNDEASLGQNEELSFRRVYFGSEECSLVNGDVKYGIHVISEGSYTGSFKCKVHKEHDFIGNRNITFIITNSFGRSLADQDLYHVDGLDTLYMFQTYDEIAVSPNTGSVNGGTLLTVTGHSFDTFETDHPTRVQIGGIPCEVVDGSLTKTSLQCLTPPKPYETHDYYTGSRGVWIEWSNDATYNTMALNDVRTKLNTNSTGYKSFYHDSAGYHWGKNLPEYNDRFVAKLTGVFHAPVDDKYMFHIRADDQAELYMTCGGNKSDMTLMAKCPYYNTNYNRLTSQRSDWLEFKKGDTCYFEAIMRNTGGPGSIDVAVLRATTTITRRQTPHAQTERQYIEWSATKTEEVQSIELVNWDTMDSRNAVNEKQTINVESNCHSGGYCATTFYYLTFRGQKTVRLKADSTSDEMEKAINKLATLSHEDVTVLRNDIMIGGNRVGYSYVVTFSLLLGNYPKFNYTIIPGQSSTFTITVSETVKGISDFKNFAIEFNGRVTGPISVDADATVVKGALERSQGAICAQSLLPPQEDSDVIFVADYEGARVNSGERGQRIKNFPAFCGLQSLKNPDTIYNKDWTGYNSIDAERYNTFCFAHYGIFMKYFKFKYTFEKEDGSNRRTLWTDIPVSIADMRKEWEYHCFNVLQIITAHVEGWLSYTPDDIVIEYIGLKKASNKPIHDFYIDAVYIGTEEPSFTLQEDLYMRLPEATFHNRRLNEFDVTKNDPAISKWEITTKFYGCPNDFELMKIDFVEDDQSGLNATTKRISAASPGMRGTFDIAYKSSEYGTQILKDLPITISASQLQERMQTLHGCEEMHVQDVDVERCHARRFYIKWLNTGGDRELIEINDERLTGSHDLNLKVETLEEGGVMHGPMTGEMIGRVYDTPQVEVFINHIPSKCNGDCGFSWDANQTPTATGITPTSGIPGTVVTISGSLLDIPNSNYTTKVKIGEKNCNISSQTASEITCEVGGISKGIHDVEVNVGGRGLATSSLQFNQTEIVIISVNPTSGYTTGGNKITISGKGFSSAVAIKISTNPCTITDVTLTSITCIVPSGTVEQTEDVIASIGGVDEETLSGGYTYSNTNQAVITSVSPDSINGVGGDLLTVSIDKFSINSKVVIGNHICRNANYSGSDLTCVAPFLKQGNYSLQVLIFESGYADTITNNIPDISYNFQVTGLDPQVSSFKGGQEFRIVGNGFDERTKVEFGDRKCSVTSLSSSQINCKLQSSEKHHVIDNQGVDEVYGKDFAWNPRVLTINAGDTVDWRWELDEKRIGDLAIRVFLCDVDNPFEPNYMNVKSHDDKVKAGSFRYKFTQPGLYHFSTGRIDDEDWGNLVMTGSVHVQRLQKIELPLSVVQKDIEAVYSPATVRMERTSSCSRVTGKITGCNDTSSSSGNDLTAKQKENFVTMHNYYRSNVHPSAVNMQMVVWDEDVMQNALRHAKLCEFRHSNEASRKDKAGFAYLGENMYAQQAIDVDMAVNKSVTSWHDEVNFYTYDNNSCEEGKVCGHYTQVVWHDSYAIGCASIICPTISEINWSSGGTLVLCQYGKGGNIQGQKPYKNGTSCNECSTNTTCDGKLCKETVSSPSLKVDTFVDSLSSGRFTASQSVCYTPYITSITPSSGTTNTTVVIEGNGFGEDTCTNTVTIGEWDAWYHCDVISSSETVIECQPNPTNETEVAIQYQVMVNVLGRGDAIYRIPNKNERTFVVLPSITDVDIHVGSFAGGTILIISGSGFEKEDISVEIRNNDVDIISINYNKIICRTPSSGANPASDSNIPSKIVIKINKGSLFTADCLGDCSFTYDKDETPTVTSISNTEISSANETIVIGGSRLNSTTVTVNIGEVPCDISSSNYTHIICKIVRLPAGPHDVNVFVSNLGLAYHANSNTKQIAGNDTVVLSPSSGGTMGGTLIRATGNFFKAKDLQVKIDNNNCKIIKRSFNQMWFSTPAKTTRTTSTVSVSISANGHTFTGVSDYKYDSSKNPMVSNVTPTHGNPGNVLEITGTKLKQTSDAESMSVTVGGAACVVQPGASDANITCILGTPDEAGTYSLKVHVPGPGNADTSAVTFTYQLNLSTVTPTKGSIAGGNAVRLNGTGFGRGIQIRICNYKCNILNEDGSITEGASISSTSLTCILEDAPTYSTRQIRAYVSTEGNFDQNNIAIFRPMVDADGYQTIGFFIDTCYPKCKTDGKTALIVRDDSGSSLVAPDDFRKIFSDTFSTGKDFSAWRPFTNRKDYVCMGDVVVDGEVKPETSIIKCIHRSLVVPTNIHTNPTYQAKSQQLSVWKVNGTNFLIASNDKDQSPDIVVYKLKEKSNSLTDKTCNVTVVTSGNDEATIEDGYQMLNSHTPTVTDVTPKRGGTGGGTNITITGTGFSSILSENVVKIDGIVCDVTAATNIEINCTTNKNRRTIRSRVVVVVKGKGKTLDKGAEFYFIDVWSSIWTWNGTYVPVDGDFVVVPKHQTLLLDTDTAKLKFLLINGGVLLFDEKDIHLQAEYILIMDDGMLRIGSKHKPFEYKAKITLHGHLRSRELPVYGTKMIAVRNGLLDLHGKPVNPTWTQLRQTAAKGDTVLGLKQPVDWPVGGEITIASTGDNHSQRENEKRTIANVSSDGMNLTLTKRLDWTHISHNQIFPGGVNLFTSAEVGLLSRNIVIQGSRHMDWTEDIKACPDGFNPGEFAKQTCFQGRFGDEVGSDQFGAQVMFHNPVKGEMRSHGRLEYVELRHVGQAFRLGRYAIHFHLMGDIKYTSHVKGCSIHESFNRAVTIHGTHKVIVENNVIYNTMGGTIFIEDGIETGNIIRGNLLVFTKQSTSLQNEDITPAAVWITNPNNIIEDNTAAGGTHFGFWYRMRDHPEGASTDHSICQDKVPLASFKGNTAHSQGWYGIWVFQNYFPKEDGGCRSATNEPAIFKSLTAWNCERGAEVVNVGAIKMDGFVMANNRLVGIEAKMINNVFWGEAGIYNSVVIGHSEISTKPDFQTQNGLKLPFYEGWMVINTQFINFDRKGSVFITTKVDGKSSDFNGGFTAKFANISFHNVTRKAGFKWEHEQIMIDMDGTLSGKGSRKIILPETGLVPTDKCEVSAEWSHGKVKGLICDGDIRLHRLSWNNVLPSSLHGRYVNITNVHGSSKVPFARKRMTHKTGWMAVLMDGERYTWVYDNADHLTNISYTSVFYDFKDGDCVIMEHQLNQEPDRFRFVNGQNKNSTDRPLTCDGNFTNGDYYFNRKTLHMEFVVNAKDDASSPIGSRGIVGHSPDVVAVNRGINAEVIRCFFTDCTPPPDPNTVPPVDKRPRDFVYWSDWIADRRRKRAAPAAMSNVEIPQNKWIVLNQAIPRLNELVIKGVLELDDTMDHVIEATYIIIWGGGARLIAGFREELPFNHSVKIVLHGNHSTPVTKMAPSINLGSKVIGVFGGLDLHGSPKNVTKTKLLKSAFAGNTSIEVKEPVDWDRGDDVLITSTSFDPWESETFKIISISESGLTITLNDSLRFDHKVTELSHAINSQQVRYTISADVARLTRNIRVEGADYSLMDEESFGGRIIVASISDDDGSVRGYSRLSNVEFMRMGQDGWNEPWDPHYAMVYVETGKQTHIKPSYVKKCTFIRNFNTALGAFDANSITFEDNIIYHTVGSSMRIEGNGNRVIGSLVSLMISPGTYQGRDNEIWYWFACIQINQARDIILQDNIVVGSERAGYWIDGMKCDALIHDWRNNEARGTLDGVYINKDGVSPCTLVKGFRIHKSYDYGIYYQSPHNLVIDDVIITDSKVGIITLFNGPSSVQHIFEAQRGHIQNTIINAQTDKRDCTSLNPSQKYLTSAPQARSPGNPNPKANGRAGMYWPSFMAGHNNAPIKPFNGLMSYPALGGKMLLKNATFVNFNSFACGQKHVAIASNPGNEDYQHPVYTKGIFFINTPEANRVFISRPSIGKIDPSNCVDMECDALKNMLIVDVDGTFLNSSGTIISQAEYEWDGEKSRGLGDYRIPKEFLTHLNGSRIKVEAVTPFKGILRANTGKESCTKQDDWQAYYCHGYKHQLFIIESMDSDSETRRLSPVALIAEKYIDLENGPQDHGWCNGYTCQKRISTFYTTVAANKKYQLFFTGTAPQVLRLTLPHIDDEDSFVVSIFYTTAHKLEVYVGNELALPKNGNYSDGEVVLIKPPDNNPDFYLPTLDDRAGSNYFDRDSTTLHVTLRGRQHITIKITPMIVISFNLPAIGVDDFFAPKNIVNNLAFFLGIKAARIRVVNIVREGSKRRRKRDAGTKIDLEISETQSGGSDIGTNSTESTGDITEVASKLVNKIQSGAGFSDVLGVEVEVLKFEKPLPKTSDPDWGTLVEALDKGIIPPKFVLIVPTGMIILRHPGPNLTPAGTPFKIQPKLCAIDEYGDIVVVGLPDYPWIVAAEAIDGIEFTGNTNASFVDGCATFEDLGVNTTGYNKRIAFKVIIPSGLNETFWKKLSRPISIAPTIAEDCSPVEGDVIYDKKYVNTGNCSHLCLKKCDYSGMEKCSDIGRCGPHAKCTNEVCTCNTESEFDESKFDSESIRETLNAEVLCHPNSIELRLDKCAMNALGFYLSQLYVYGNGPNVLNTSVELDVALVHNSSSCENTCRGSISVDTDGFMYSFTISDILEDCNADVKENDTSITYSYVLHGEAGVASGFITRIQPIEVTFSCTYLRNLQSSLAFAIRPFIRTVKFDVASKGTFKILFGMWNDGTYAEPISDPAIIRVPNYIHLGVSVDGVEDAVLLLQKCWATSQDFNEDTTKYPIITDSCPAQEPNVDDAVVITEDGAGNEARFAFRAFVFEGQASNNFGELYIHCEIHVCVDDISPCTPRCKPTPTRRKRSANRPLFSQEITLGPIYVQGDLDVINEDGGKINKRSIQETESEMYLPNKEGLIGSGYVDDILLKKTLYLHG